MSCNCSLAQKEHFYKNKSIDLYYHAETNIYNMNSNLCWTLKMAFLDTEDVFNGKNQGAINQALMALNVYHFKRYDR